MKDKEKLIQFFTVTNAAFTMMRTVMSAFNKNYLPNPMELLHRMALNELEKDDTDWAFLDGLLAKMEEVAEENKAVNQERETI